MKLLLFYIKLKQLGSRFKRIQSLLLHLKDVNDYQVDVKKLEVNEESCGEQ